MYSFVGEGEGRIKCTREGGGGGYQDFLKWGKECLGHCYNY